MKKLYDTTKMLSGSYNHPERPVKDKEGNQITGEENQRKRWVEHIEEILNRPVPSNPAIITPAENDLEINCNPPNKEEIRQAINHLKTGKASGPDGIPAEELKAEIETTVGLFYCPLIKYGAQNKYLTNGKKVT